MEKRDQDALALWLQLVAGNSKHPPKNEVPNVLTTSEQIFGGSSRLVSG